MRADLAQIKADIDADYYALSVAYYDAYIAPGLATSASQLNL